MPILQEISWALLIIRRVVFLNLIPLLIKMSAITAIVIGLLAILLVAAVGWIVYQAVNPPAPCPTPTPCPSSPEQIVLTPPNPDITGGGQVVATLNSPQKLTRVSIIMQDTANPPQQGTKISIHDGPGVNSPILATLTTKSTIPVQVTSGTLNPQSNRLTVISGSGPGSSTDVGRVYTIIAS